QFVCATNWMRASIPDYNKLIDPLRRLLDVAVKAAGSSKKKALARVELSLVGWSQDHAACFEDVKSALANVVPLSHPNTSTNFTAYTGTDSRANYSVDLDAVVVQSEKMEIFHLDGFLIE
ncbi:unnamed protein product, partial [Aphanomyces euteiches]